jgi:hypothetical protein
MALHVVHFAMALFAQPLQQMRLVFIQICIGNTNSLEPQLVAPLLDLTGQLRKIR